MKIIARSAAIALVLLTAFLARADWYGGGGGGGSASVTLQQQAASGRLTLTSGTTVLTATVSGATTVYFTPYQNNLFTEVSQLTTDTTKSPAATVANSNYDVFCWLAPAFSCTRGPPWTSNTARGSGAGTTQISGMPPTNTVAITNGPGAGQGYYVGSFRTNASATVDYTFAAAASGGAAGVISIWNYYNRRHVGMKDIDNGTNYNNYSSATIRQARGSAGNQISFLSGLPEDAVFAVRTGSMNSAAVAGAFSQTGIGLDSTTTYDGGSWALNTAPTTAGLQQRFSITDTIQPQLGWHTVSANENADGTNSPIFNNNSTDSLALDMWN
jgi:hypothetical protein